MRRAWWVAAMTAAVSLGAGVFGIPSAQAAPARPDQACTAASNYAWAAPTESQSFSPNLHTLTGVSLRIAFVSKFHTTLPVRIVLHPSGDVMGDTQGPGYVVATANLAVAGKAFQFSWFRVNFPTPVSIVSLPFRGTYSIDVDFPLDLAFQPYGAHLGWAECDSYGGGRGYVTYSPDSLRRTFAYEGANFGLGPLPTDPVLGEANPQTFGYGFITYGR